MGAKLSLKFIGPFKVMGQVGAVAYRLVLPLNLSMVHNMFYASMLKKYITDPSHVIRFT